MASSLISPIPSCCPSNRSPHSGQSSLSGLNSDYRDVQPFPKHFHTSVAFHTLRVKSYMWPRRLYMDLPHSADSHSVTFPCGFWILTWKVDRAVFFAWGRLLILTFPMVCSKNHVKHFPVFLWKMSTLHPDISSAALTGWLMWAVGSWLFHILVLLSVFCLSVLSLCLSHLSMWD